MKHNESASTDATLDRLARFCNQFFAKNQLQYTINDLVCWICGKPNPYYFPDLDARLRRVGAGVKEVLKGLLKFYEVRPTGRFVHEHQFDLGLWVWTGLKEIRKLCGRAVTYGQYLYARKALIRSGILKIKKITQQYRGTRLAIQIDFDQLQKLLDDLPELKKQIPGTDNWPLPGRASVESTSNLQENASPPTPDVPSPGDEVLSSSSENSTIGCADPTTLDPKPTGEFANQPFGGILDAEGQTIVSLLQDFFGGQFTNGQIRLLNALRRRKECQHRLTLGKIQRFLSFHDVHPWALDWWMEKVTLDKLLKPGVWVSIAQAMKRHEFADIEVTVEDLESVADCETDMEAVLYKLRDSPDSYWDELARIERTCRTKPWVMYALYGRQKGWVSALMRPILAKAKAVIMKSPMLFSKTNHLVDWTSLLGLSAAEVKSLHQQANTKERAMKWRVHLAHTAGVI